MRLLCCSSCSKDAFTKLFVANICPWVVLLWNRRGARQDYSQMIPHIRNNNNNNIVCFDTRKLFEPCTKFPPPQIPNIFMELIIRPATTRIKSKPPRKTTWPSLNMILRLQLRVASPLRPPTIHRRNGTVGWQVATEEKLSIRTISANFKLEDTSRMVPTIIVQLLANEWNRRRHAETVLPLMVCCSSTWRDFIAGDNRGTFVLWIFPVSPRTLCSSMLILLTRSDGDGQDNNIMN